MKRFILPLLLLSCISFSYASNNNTDCNSSTQATTEIQKWEIKADTWVVDEQRWLEWPQLITILWSEERGLYMWSIGGSTTDVVRSDKRGYDYMVKSHSHRNWIFYFNQSDLR